MSVLRASPPWIIIFIRYMSILLVVLFTSSCTYLKYASVQARYAQIQNAEPNQRNVKHMLDRDTFFVFGKAIDDAGNYTNTPMAISAYSSKYRKNERVDTMHFQNSGTHYGLNLPAGTYKLLVYADLNRDGIFSSSETVGARNLEVNAELHAEKILSGVDIRLTAPTLTEWADTFNVPATSNEQSIFFPANAIRKLNDPVFDDTVATLGMYDPASFLEHAPTMFYALEEDTAHKVPVVFVHGIGGGSRSFENMVAQIDLSRYKPWFFYYPSGGDLDQLATLFYQIFLSGEVIPLSDTPLIVVAHSMGGLVVREAINRYEGNARENRMKLLVTIATPFSGHPSAAIGEKRGTMVLPAWRDLNPQSKFIRDLFRKPLPDFVNHQLFYAYGNNSTVKFGSNSDGVVPLASQLDSRAQKQAQEKFGFNSGHVDILSNSELITQLVEKIGTVKGIFPESHIQVLLEGGFTVDVDKRYSPLTHYLIGYAGKYFVLLANNKITPINSQHERFAKAIRGEVPASTTLEKEFKKFMQEHQRMIEQFLKSR